MIAERKAQSKPSPLARVQYSIPIGRAMLVVLATAFALQVQVTVQQKASDSTRKAASVGAGARVHRREPRRLPVTPELLATAFKDENARALLGRARSERMSQDSALIAYEATTYQRISAGMGFSRIGRDRLIFRQEGATHVRWQRGVGAWVDVTGARTAIPIAPDEAREETREEINSSDISPIPYFPGVEPLISFNDNGAVAQQVDERELVNPLAEGSEAYYTYETGDSITYRLPGGRTIQLRELRVRPRRLKWNVVVGSLWFDASTGQVVRAAYRLSDPMDIWAVAKDEDPHAMDDVPVWVKPVISPMHAEVSAIAIEYGLYEGRFWLPRMKALEGSAQVSFMHMPFKLEQNFRYQSVNADLELPPIVVSGPRLDTLPDSLRMKVRDSLRVARRAERDSVRRGLKQRPKSACDTADYRVISRYRYSGAHLAVATRVPCDLSKLENSPDLPKSIYDDGEEIFGVTDRDALIAAARSMVVQPPFMLGRGTLPPPTVSWGAQFMRYNRVEGFSFGGRVEQQLGGGYAASAEGRIGLADLEPNVELRVSRTNLVRTLSIGGYNHLVSAGDWGNPLSFGSSLSALLFGRDEGFYYRASGVDFAGGAEEGTGGRWRVFAEQQRTASQNTSFSLGPAFTPNIAVRRATYVGGAYRFLSAYGENPFGFRLSSDMRLEAAAAKDSVYGRGALDLTASHGLGGDVVGALTVSGGSSLGALPEQRRWFLGGTQTIRGERPDTALSGNAYWFGRVELGRQFGAVRPTLFSDVGWVGDRSHMAQIGRPLSGVGSGVSLMDGLIRFDLARGLYPQQRWRSDFYLNARF